MLDGVVMVLMENLVDVLLHEGHLILQFHKQFKVIKKELILMQSYLKDFDKVRMKERKETQKTVLEGLRELLYDAEDVIADCELFFKREKRMAAKYLSYCSPAYLKLRHRIGNRLQEINQDIKNHRERMASYLSTLPLPNKESVVNSQPEIYPVLTNDDDIVGLDNDAHKIKQWISEAHQPLTVIAIVGMGGIGKTTLAEKICNSGSVKECFDQVLFVTVSQNVDFPELIKGILRKLSIEERLLKGDLRGLLRELQNKLDRKRNLLILDDVWGVDEGRWWESLKSAFPQMVKDHGNCVIVTTRNEEVSRKIGASYIHKPTILSEKDSWSLFTRITFAREGGRCVYSNLETIGKDIVAKCGGLPLAIKVVAGIMLGKGDSINEWKRILQGFATRENYRPVMSTLELSYEELPTHLKPCLLCFGAFPEDYEIDLSDLIDWWIGEGFVQRRDRRTTFEIGEEYFNELISRCLLLGVGKTIFGKIYLSCRVHDMVRDMILKIASEEKFMDFAEGHGLPSVTSPRRVNLPSNGNTNFFGDANSKKLRTITGVRIHESSVFCHNLVLPLCQVKWLRVLNISFDSEYCQQPQNKLLFNWLNGLRSVPHLICLKIENSTLDEIPDFFGNLHNLQSLGLSFCRYLKRLPDSVTSLEKLISFNVFGCDALEYLPRGIGQLPNLKTLLGFRSASSAIKDGCRISHLNALTQLQQLWLEISSEDQTEVGDLNVLPNLKQLKRLTISTNHRISETITPKEDYEFAPLQQLEELHLFCCQGQRTPSWLNPACLPSLRYLYISDGNVTHFSPGFFGSKGCKFSELEGLALSDLENLEEEWPSMQLALPSLRLLKIYQCDKLKYLPSNMVTEGYFKVWRKEEQAHKFDSNVAVTK